MLHGHVTGLDLNKGMLAVAQTRVREGASIDWIAGSALNLPFPAEKFNLVLCQLGLPVLFQIRVAPSAKCAGCCRRRVASRSASTVQ